MGWRSIVQVDLLAAGKIHFLLNRFFMLQVLPLEDESDKPSLGRYYRLSLFVSTIMRFERKKRKGMEWKGMQWPKVIENLFFGLARRNE